MSSSIGTVLLLQIFPALLPPKNDTDRDFYSVLDLEKGATEQDIRKAYKKKSLALHPDKQAQRGASVHTAEEAAKEYQLVQEAHACLSTPEGRQRYHAVQCSPTRYRFLTQEGGLGNQTQIVKNLSQASFGDKTRLVLFVSLFPALLLVQPILVAVKVNHILAQDGGALEQSSWMAILIPWWFFHVLWIVFWAIVAVVAPPQAKFPIVTTCVEATLWLIAMVLLALRWDQTITIDYALVFVPVYFALVMKWIHTLLLMQQISKDMAKMVSKDHFLNVILQGREPEELEEEELKELTDKYVVVQQIPEDIEHDLDHDAELKDLSDEEKEEIRVSSSREFEAALEAYTSARNSIGKSMVLDVAFLVLLILKIDNHLPDLSWWVVFSPILVAYVLRYLRSCYGCCCQATPALDPDEAVVMAAMEKKAQEDAADAETDKKQDENAGHALQSTVILHSLKTDEFNGKIGTIKGPLNAETGRQEVYIEQLDKTVALKMENLAPVDGTSAVLTAHGQITIGGGDGDDNDGAGAETATSDPQKQEATPAPPRIDSSAADSSNNKTDDKKDEIAAENTAPKSDDPADAKSGEEHPTSPTETTTAASGTGNPAEGDDKDGDGDEASIHIDIDPETYRAYQSAYAAAQQNAMENRAKAGQDNCVTTIKIVMVCLLVAKLEQAYQAIEEREENEQADVDVGFNTLWLIFPLFLVVGFMISCCACLIYSAPDPDELMQQDQEGGEAGDEEAAGGGGDAPVVFAPPPPEMDVPSPNESKKDNAAEAQPAEPPEAANNDDETKKQSEAGGQDNPPEPPSVEEDVGGDMNDLD